MNPVVMDVLDDILEAHVSDTENAGLSRASNSKSDYLRLIYEDFEIKVQNVVKSSLPNYHSGLNTYQDILYQQLHLSNEGLILSDRKRNPLGL